ncbi:MAG TPA: DUF488 domain-containing protein [Terriglobales bacterium]|nr:DUF488 domain-containing protein [Terriglobales bacterium]
MLKLKRAYEPAARDDGRRFLVERLWPRGVTKNALRLDLWLKNVAPSPELRKWFSHDPKKWSEFQTRYRAELRENSDALGPLLQAAREGTVTLVYAARDPERNSARVLRDYIAKKLSSSETGRKSAA